MKLQSFKDALRPLRDLPDAKAINKLNSAILITGEGFEAFATWGQTHSKVSTGVTGLCLVDAMALLSIAQNVKSDQDIELTVDEGVFSWKCGRANGRLSHIAGVELPDLAFPSRLKGANELSSEVAGVLELGALSCGSRGLASVGLYGIQVAGDGVEFRVASSDSATVSCAETPSKITCALTLSPQGASYIASLARLAACVISFDGSSVFIKSETIKARVGTISPLKHDVAEMVGNHPLRKSRLALSREAVTSFLKRAASMSETKEKYIVSLSVTDGNLELVYDNDAAQMEEFFLADGLPIKHLDPIKVDAQRMARALQDVDSVVLDYADKGVLILTAEKPSFCYLIASTK